MIDIKNKKGKKLLQDDRQTVAPSNCMLEARWFSPNTTNQQTVLNNSPMALRRD